MVVLSIFGGAWRYDTVHAARIMAERHSFWRTRFTTHTDRDAVPFVGASVGRYIAATMRVE